VRKLAQADQMPAEGRGRRWDLMDCRVFRLAGSGPVQPAEPRRLSPPERLPSSVVSSTQIKLRCIHLAASSAAFRRSSRPLS